jgi:ubiquinone/menaquinone biosynthesis C-methylase UbiE
LFKTGWQTTADTVAMSEHAFTPAAGRFAPMRFYDPVVARTRERLWRSLAVMYIAPRPGDVIADVGCGTGSLAVLLSRVEPRTEIVALDPDPEVLALARSKADAAGVTVDWRVSMGDVLVDSLGANSVDTVVSSLVLHQCPLPMKRAILGSMYEVLKPGGKVVIADFGLQRTALMRLAFRIVQLADGKADTQPNADGVLLELLSECGFQEVREAEVVSTVNGSISVYVARKD